MASSGEHAESDPAADPWSGLCCRLRSLIRRRVAHAHDAEDIVGEAVLRALAWFAEAPRPMDLLRWTVNTARGLAADRARNRHRWAQDIDPVFVARDDNYARNVELRDHLAAASSVLSPADRQVLSMLLAGADTDIAATAQRVSSRAIRKAKARIWRAYEMVGNCARQVPNPAARTV